jgi:hypothetical protein
MKKAKKRTGKLLLDRTKEIGQKYGVTVTDPPACFQIYE